VGYYVGVFANAGELEMALPPVDEPAGAGLLLAGLSLLWRARRRR
jgi:MYXO-CTERM domain-containing protein